MMQINSTLIDIWLSWFYESIIDIETSIKYKESQNWVGECLNYFIQITGHPRFLWMLSQVICSPRKKDRWSFLMDPRKTTSFCDPNFSHAKPYQEESIQCWIYLELKLMICNNFTAIKYSTVCVCVCVCGTCSMNESNTSKW